MPEEAAATGQETGGAETTPFVALSDAPTSRESDAAPITEQTAASDGEATPMDEVEYDANDPVMVAAFKKLRADMFPKWQKRVEELKGAKPAENAQTEQAAKPEPKAAEQTQQPAASDDPFASLYEFSADDVKLEPTTFPEGHSLAGFEADLDSYVDDRFAKMAQRLLGRIQKNDQSFRSTAAEREANTKFISAVSPYFEAVREHPEFDEKMPAIREFAQKTKEWAFADPEGWAQTVEQRFGLDRNWKGLESDQRQRDGQRNQRLANKTIASVPRPQGRRTLADAAASGDMSRKDAIDKAMRAAGVI